MYLIVRDKTLTLSEKRPDYLDETSDEVLFHLTVSDAQMRFVQKVLAGPAADQQAFLEFLRDSFEEGDTTPIYAIAI